MWWGGSSGGTAGRVAYVGRRSKSIRRSRGREIVPRSYGPVLKHHWNRVGRTRTTRHALTQSLQGVPHLSRDRHRVDASAIRIIARRLTGAQTDLTGGGRPRSGGLCRTALEVDPPGSWRGARPMQLWTGSRTPLESSGTDKDNTPRPYAEPSGRATPVRFCSRAEGLFFGTPRWPATRNSSPPNRVVRLRPSRVGLTPGFPARDGRGRTQAFARHPLGLHRMKVAGHKGL